MKIKFLSINLIVWLIFLIIGLYFFVKSFTYDLGTNSKPGAGFFPLIISSCYIILMAIILRIKSFQKNVTINFFLLSYVFVCFLIVFFFAKQLNFFFIFNFIIFFIHSLFVGLKKLLSGDFLLFVLLLNLIFFTLFRQNFNFAMFN